MTQQHEVKLACSYCGKLQKQVRKLIAGPTVYICDECIKLCNDLLAEPANPAEPPGQPADRAERSPLCCSFCGKNEREVKRMIAGPSARICDGCVGLCNDIISEEIEREEWAATLRDRLPSEARALIVGILERGMPAAFEIRDVLRERIFEDIDRRRAAGKAPDELLWLLEGFAAEWRGLRDILARAALREGEAGRGGPVEEEIPPWVSPIAERLAQSLEVLSVLARSLERPGLEEARQLGPSVAVARGKLEEARQMLLAVPSRSPGEGA